jgi:hypothetical protein
MVAGRDLLDDFLLLTEIVLDVRLMGKALLHSLLAILIDPGFHATFPRIIIFSVMQFARKKGTSNRYGIISKS